MAFSQIPNQKVSVNTPCGLLTGAVKNGVNVFKGVPFALPPTGPLRFKPSVDIKRWSGEWNASQFAHAAMQPHDSHSIVSEDCLYLNVWTPVGKGPFPVFVWIHGGGYTGGASFDATTDGTQFASEGIIVVTVAYRLGIFGFLDVEPILGEKYAGSANNGVSDVISALRWIQRNVESLGGDPSRVTIGGELAGAKLTDTLMGTPSADGLFHQMISESGGCERVSTKNEATIVTSDFQQVWADRLKESETDLLTADPELLIKAQDDFTATCPKHFPLRPEIDGLILPRLPIDSIRAGCAIGKNFLVGTNHDESALFYGTVKYRPITSNDLGNITLSEFDRILALYKTLYPELTERRQQIAALTAEEYWVPSIRVADSHADAGGNAYMYRLDFTESTGEYADYAYHSLDVGMVWGKPHKDVGNKVEEAALSVKMHGAWASFIKTGVPVSSELPVWPKYEPELRKTMILNTECTVEIRPKQVELELWNDVL